MSVFTIKIIACISMVIDHIKYAIPTTQNFITIYGGRIAFPLFAFLITEGYVHTRDLKKYYKRLLLFAIISQMPFMLFRTLVGEYMLLNIMFTLIMGLLAITVYDKINKKVLSIPLVLLIIWLGKLLNVDYGWFGVALVFLIYIFKNNKIILTISIGTLIALYYYLEGIISIIGVQALSYYLIFNFLIPIICICLYNGKIGKKAKYLFYSFYPVHMLIIYFISLFN